MIEDKHFLYVEDDEKSRRVMALLMERVLKVKHVTMFPDSTDFMKNLLAMPSRPDMILLDIQMQPVDGFGVLKLLRAHPDYQTVPVIALTASVMNEEVERLRAEGFTGVIAKPIDPRLFPTLMVRLFNGESIWHIAD